MLLTELALAGHAVLYGDGVQVAVGQRQVDVPRSDVTAETLQVVAKTRRRLHGNALREVLLRRAAQRNPRGTIYYTCVILKETRVNTGVIFQVKLLF